MVIKKILPILFALVAIFSLNSNIFAAGGSISVNPTGGNFTNGEVFTVAVQINGGGTAFNASKAKVSISQNLIVQSLTLGNCGFAFVETPTTTSLSYTGVILGDSSNSCTVYTLSLKVVGGGVGNILISDGSIKSHKGAQEIFTAVENGSYSFGGKDDTFNTSNVTPTRAPLLSNTSEKLYTVVYGIGEVGKDVSNIKVILDRDRPEQMIVSPSPLSDNPTMLAAMFENVPAGVHTVDVMDNDTSVSSEVLNIEGQNREMVLGVTPREANSMIWYMLVGISIVIIITILIAAYILYWKKTHQVE